MLYVLRSLRVSTTSTASSVLSRERVRSYSPCSSLMALLPWMWCVPSLAGACAPHAPADFFDSLRKDGSTDAHPLRRHRPVDQQREQWFSAANLLAVAPGKVVIYRSSERTIAELERHAYKVIDINDVQLVWSS